MTDKIKEGDMIKINFVGRVKDSGKVFDTTYEDIARREGIFKENVRYAPQPVITGHGFVINGVDEQLTKMAIGDEREFEVKADKAFGERKDELIKIVPLKEFKDRNITPYPGLVVNFGGTLGKIKSVSGGRVQVDFNSDLAGKDVVYKIQVVKKAETLEDKIGALIALCFTTPEYQKFKFNDGGLFMQLSPNLYGDPRAATMKQRFVNLAFTYLEGVARVSFMENYVKKAPDTPDNVRRTIDITPIVEEMKNANKSKSAPKIDLKPNEAAKGQKAAKNAKKKA